MPPISGRWAVSWVRCCRLVGIQSGKGLTTGVLRTVELLEGKPPYHHLDPMPALFRIVNDDCPPLPESASPTARDFMLQCFQKDPCVLRSLSCNDRMLELISAHLQQSPHQRSETHPAPVDGRR